TLGAPFQYFCTVHCPAIPCLRCNKAEGRFDLNYLNNDFHFLDQTPTPTRPRPPAGCRGVCIGPSRRLSLSSIRCDKYHNGQTCLWSLRYQSWATRDSAASNINALAS